MTVDVFINKKMFINQSDYRWWMEKRKCKNYFSHLYILYIIFVIYVPALCKAEDEACNFIGSGLTSDPSAVQTVYLSCKGGKVSWTYPKGAIRVVLSHPSQKDFRSCIKSPLTNSGGRIFMEGHRRLINLYPEGVTNKTRCFSSYRSRIAYYIEASPSNSFHKQSISFDYELDLSDEEYNPAEDCKPCTRAQIISHYCSSAFIAKGIITKTEDDPSTSQTLITFAAARVFQQATPIFTETSHQQPAARVGNIRVPIHCGARQGPGEFLVMGNVRFGEPLLRCSISYEKWKRLVLEAQHEAQCVLET